MTAASAPAAPRREHASIGAASVLRLVLRRDRVLLPLWILLTVGALAGNVTATASTYPTAQDRADRFQQVHDVPMFPLFQSMIFDDSAPAIAAQQAFAATTLVAALGAVLLVVRHTRSEEQRGRRELLGSAAIGRSAPLAATLLAVLTGGLISGLLGTGVLIGIGLPVVGSVLLGLVVTGAAAIGAAVAAVLSQISDQGRTAALGGIGLVVAMHFLRGLGHLLDPSDGRPALLSPSGWLEAVRPYAGDRWWMLLPVGALVAVLVVLGLGLSSRRDLGAGMLPVRRARERASPRLRGIMSLTLRRSAPSFVAWGCVTAVVGLAFGSLGATAVADYADSPWMIEYAAAIGVADPARAFFVYVVFVLVFPLAVPPLLAMLRLRADETDGTADLLLSAPVPRRRWALASVLVAFTGCAALFAVLGLALTVAAPEVDGLFLLALSLVPAVWVILGIAVLAIGVLPRAAVAISWTALGVGVAGEILVKAGLPDVVYLALSPMAHVNPYYATPYAWLALLVVAVATTAGGLIGIRRRDLMR